MTQESDLWQTVSKVSRAQELAKQLLGVAVAPNDMTLTMTASTLFMASLIMANEAVLGGDFLEISVNLLRERVQALRDAEDSKEKQG